MNITDSEVIVSNGQHGVSIEPWLSLIVLIVALTVISLLAIWKGARAGRVGVVTGAILLPVAKTIPLVIMYGNISKTYGVPFQNLLPSVLELGGFVLVLWLILSLPALWLAKKLYQRRTAVSAVIGTFDSLYFSEDKLRLGGSNP